jgi:hypothetical protein
MVDMSAGLMAES